MRDKFKNWLITRIGEGGGPAEPVGVNLVANSQEFASPPYIVGSGLQLTNYAGLDPKGGNNAKTLATNSIDGNQASLKIPSFPFQQGQQTISLYVRPEQLSKVVFYVLKPDFSGFNAQVLFNVAQGNVQNLQGDSAFVVPDANGFSRILLTHTLANAYNGELNIQIFESTESNYADKLQFFGLQLNPGSIADTYTQKP